MPEPLIKIKVRVSKQFTDERGSTYDTPILDVGYCHTDDAGVAHILKAVNDAMTYADRDRDPTTPDTPD